MSVKVLLAVPHYFKPEPRASYGSEGPDPAPRLAALEQTLLAALALSAQRQVEYRIVDRKATRPSGDLTVDIVLVTSGSFHLLERLRVPGGTYEHRSTDAAPRKLGYEAHAVLKERLGGYDWYGYLEDDLCLRDPMFFGKLRAFQECFGPRCLLQPNRFETGWGRGALKAYIDGDLADRVTLPFAPVHLYPPLSMPWGGFSVALRAARNPHSGCFFLTDEQLRDWSSRPYFLDRSEAFIGPLESAATLGIFRTFQTYKPTAGSLSFLEVEHWGTRFLSLLGTQLSLVASE